MALYQVTVAIWLLFILMNGAGYMIADWGVNLCSEPELSHLSCGWATQFISKGFNSTEMDRIGVGTLYNATTPTDTLLVNITNPRNVSSFGFSAINTTGSPTGDLLDPIIDTVDTSTFSSEEFLRFVTGQTLAICSVCNFIENSADSMGILLPTGLVFLITAGLGAVHILLAVFMISGKAF